MSIARKFNKEGSVPTNGEIFVFGSNLAGRHGAGSALLAFNNYGAKYGVGEGFVGQSYAVPTKDGRPGTPPLADPRATLSKGQIRLSIMRFLIFARSRPDLEFFVVRLGCALACHKNEDIAPMFLYAPSNCSFSEIWKPWLGEHVKDGTVATGINIASGALGIGGALTNMSELARKKGNIKQAYPVTVAGKTYVDSEAAYQHLKRPGDTQYNDELMIGILAQKLIQNESLLLRVTYYGGSEWLKLCSHHTGARTPGFQSWEGTGIESRFIRNLIAGYELAMKGSELPPVLQKLEPQTTLF